MIAPLCISVERPVLLLLQILLPILSISINEVTDSGIGFPMLHPIHHIPLGDEMRIGRTSRPSGTEQPEDQGTHPNEAPFFLHNSILSVATRPDTGRRLEKTSNR